MFFKQTKLIQSRVLDIITRTKLPTNQIIVNLATNGVL
jgi:hypothetical protein